MGLPVFLPRTSRVTVPLVRPSDVYHGIALYLNHSTNLRSKLLMGQYSYFTGSSEGLLEGSFGVKRRPTAGILSVRVVLDTSLIHKRNKHPSSVGHKCGQCEKDDADENLGLFAALDMEENRNQQHDGQNQRCHWCYPGR